MKKYNGKDDGLSQFLNCLSGIVPENEPGSTTSLAIDFVSPGGNLPGTMGLTTMGVLWLSMFKSASW